ncbi:MAG: transposase zinc-binding domain-containing protein, partial [Elusimicrobiota bacterium]
MADLLRTYGREYLAERGARACLTERLTLAELAACRTPALGSHIWRCDNCGHEHEAYNSCRNRHCPTC